MLIDAAKAATGRIAIAEDWLLWKLAALRSAGLPFQRLDAFAVAGEPERPSGTERDAEARAATRAAVNGFLLDETFASALTWQNPEVMANWAADYAASVRAGRPAGLPRMARREALIARYAQRYCAKNDTVGFFGPVAWAELGGTDTVVSGSGGIVRSAVGFEIWALQAVARHWNADPELRPFLPVRIDPAVTVAGDAARRPRRPLLALPPGAARLLAGLPASVEELTDRHGEGAGALIDQLAREQVVRVGFAVPIDGSPERHLREQVEQITHVPVRRRLLAVLGELEAARAAVAAARGSSALAEALGLADAAFGGAIGVLPASEERGAADPTPVRRRPAAQERAARSSALAAGGRTPLYTDCRRDLDAVIGDDALNALAGPLSVVLDAARWLAAEIGQAANEEFIRRYRELRQGREVVTLAEFQLACADVLDPAAELYAEVRTDFQLRWAEILPEGPDDAVVPVDRARELAKVLFKPRGRLWAAAKVHSPDVLPRRAEDGSLHWVLGELHVALNTLESRVFATMADDARALTQAVADDAVPHRVVPVYPASAAEISSRTYPPLALDPPGMYRYWSYGSDDGHPSGAPSTPASDLVVHEADDDLLATSAQDGWQAPVVECFGEFLTAVVVNMFKIRSPRRSAPRVAIGDLTVCRRQWRVDAAETGPLPERSRDPVQGALREWAARRGLPRHVFVGSPLEPKPFYVDFQAPALVDNFARAVRRVAALPPGRAHLDIAEMLPAPSELWLSDPEGGRYTSELRIVAVDQHMYPAASWAVDGARQHQEGVGLAAR